MPFVPLHRKRTLHGVIRTIPVRRIRRTGAASHRIVVRATRQTGAATHRLRPSVIACHLRRRTHELRATRVPAARWHTACLV